MDLSKHTVDSLRIAVMGYRQAEKRVEEAKEQLRAAGQEMDQAQAAVGAGHDGHDESAIYQRLLAEGNTRGARAYAEYRIIRDNSLGLGPLWRDRIETCDILLKDD